VIVYLHDGSFEGILTAVYEAYYSNIKPDKILPHENLEMNLMDTYIHINTDFAKSDKVYGSALEKISPESLKNAFHVFLSEIPEAGTLIYNYLKLGFKYGGKVDMNLTDDTVLEVHRISRRVSFETHRFTGLLRFQKLRGEIYYSTYEPDNNITMPLAPHFQDRLNDQRWIIHDLKRNLAAVYNLKEWVITDTVPGKLPSLAEGEEFFELLWREYFKSMAIKERINPRLQKQMMPVRYWKYLSEKKGV
jgi:probable DNA metabolism protein